MNKLFFNLGMLLKVDTNIEHVDYRIVLVTDLHSPYFKIQYLTVKHYLFIRSRFVWVDLKELKCTANIGETDWFIKEFESVEYAERFMRWMCSENEQVVQEGCFAVHKSKLINEV